MHLLVDSGPLYPIHEFCISVIMSIKLASYSYSDSNSSNDFAQNQYADSPWHAEFENGNHLFLGQTV